MTTKKAKPASKEVAALSNRGKVTTDLPAVATSGLYTEPPAAAHEGSNTTSAVGDDTLTRDKSVSTGDLTALENAPTLVDSMSSEDRGGVDDSATTVKSADDKTSKTLKKNKTLVKRSVTATTATIARKSRHDKTSAAPVNILREAEENPGEAEVPETDEKKKGKFVTKIKAPKRAKLVQTDANGATKKRKAPADGLTHTKRQKLNGYGIKHGQSPFPDLISPTPEQCKEVVDILSKYHINSIPPKAVPPPSLKIAGCGQVPAVHDALLRTRISAATKTDNANNAIENLVKVYGIAENGVGKGSINWNAIRLGSREKLLQALKCGGLAGVKSKDIKEILDIIAEQNRLRCEKLVAEGGTLTEEDKDPLTLQHIKELDTEAAYVALIQYPGIGVKTAACVILFCLQRPCYAVDTHVWRLTKDLGWVPPKANEIKTFAHCQVRVPDEFKYKLHQLFWHHGQQCVRCRAGTSEKSEDWDKGCPIDHLVTRFRKERKVTAIPVKGKAKVKVVSDDDDEDELDEVFLEDGLTEDDSSEGNLTSIGSDEETKAVEHQTRKSKSAKLAKAPKPAKAAKPTRLPAPAPAPAPAPEPVKSEPIFQLRYSLRSRFL